MQRYRDLERQNQELQETLKAIGNQKIQSLVALSGELERLKADLFIFRDHAKSRPS